ncbi:MAG TPA: hypothetical protein VFD36_11790 [Kofleriaceae bacterium]|nr:hypothetical protein [Kofleriaceae bacterium]
MQDITTPSISILESITPGLLVHVSGGCGHKCRPPAPPAPPPPPPPLPRVMRPPEEQESAGGPQVINSVTITTAGGAQQRVV